jgi:drug/metabolite transporter (DMT)-like permease
LLDFEKMQRLGGRSIAYIAFGAFCALSSARDVISEALFKDHTNNASPVFVLFVYSVVTQFVAGAALLVDHHFQRAIHAIGHEKHLLLLNGFTLAAFFFYFLAISSPLGAAMNSFVDYGSSPAFTAIVGALLAQERLDRTFTISALVSLTGIIVLFVPRVYIDEFSLLWAAGLALSLLSSISSAFYRVYFKLLLVGGMTKSAVIFIRLFGITIALGAILLIRPELFRVDLLAETAIVGLVGFTLPLFLTLSILQRLTIRSFAILLFAVPALTFLLSASLGYAHFFTSDLLAAGLAVSGVFLHERRGREPGTDSQTV